MSFFGFGKRKTDTSLPAVPASLLSASAPAKLRFVYADVAAKIRPRLRTEDLENRAAAFFPHVEAEGYFKGYHGYPHYVTASVNDEVIMTPPSRRELQDGDLLKLQIGLKSGGQHAYIAWTHPVGTPRSEDTALMAAGQEALLAGAKQLRGSVTVGEVSRAMDATIREHGYLPNRDYVGYRIGEQPTMPPEIPCAFLEGEAMPRKLRNGMVVVLVVIVHAGSPACHIFQDDPWNVRTKDGSRSALFSSMFEIDGNGARWLTEPIGDMQGRP